MHMNGQKRSGTVNGQERWTVRNAQERWTVRNGQERSGTVNGQKRWTVWNDHTVQDHGPKRLKNHGTFSVRSRYGHAHASKAKETLYCNHWFLTHFFTEILVREKLFLVTFVKLPQLSLIFFKIIKINCSFFINTLFSEYHLQFLILTFVMNEKWEF